MTVTEAIESANQGNTAAMFQLGRYYYQKEDFEEAQKWFLKGAEAGDVHCMVLVASVGTILARADRALGSAFAADCVRDLEGCLSWAERARANGEECDTTWLETELGICCYLAFSHDRGKTEYLQRAEEMLKAHYPIEDIEARMYLAFALHDKAHLKFGLDNKDASLRLSLLTDCAKHRSELVHGDIACYYLGEAYLDGIGCQRDDDKAYQWMSLAQEMGFNCQVILRRFKKRLFGGYVFQG